jgi:hypothetical protein
VIIEGKKSIKNGKISKTILLELRNMLSNFSLFDNLPLLSELLLKEEKVCRYLS